MRFKDALDDDLKQFLLKDTEEKYSNNDLALFILYKHNLPKDLLMKDLVKNKSNVTMSYNEYIFNLKNSKNEDIIFLHLVLTLYFRMISLREPDYCYSAHREFVTHLEYVVSKNKEFKNRLDVKQLLLKEKFENCDRDLITEILCSCPMMNPTWLGKYFSDLYYYNYYNDNKKFIDFIQKIKNMTLEEFFNTYEIVLM